MPAGSGPVLLILILTIPAQGRVRTVGVRKSWRPYATILTLATIRSPYVALLNSLFYQKTNPARFPAFDQKSSAMLASSQLLPMRQMHGQMHQKKPGKRKPDPEHFWSGFLTLVAGSAPTRSSNASHASTTGHDGARTEEGVGQAASVAALREGLHVRSTSKARWGWRLGWADHTIR